MIDKEVSTWLEFIKAITSKQSGKTIKERQHSLYDEELRLIGRGERDAIPFNPQSELGELRTPTNNIARKFVKSIRRNVQHEPLYGILAGK